MKRIIMAGLAMAELFGVAVLHGEMACSNESLKGAYGAQITGTRPAPSVLSGIPATPGTTEQVIGVVTEIFDGNGGFTQTDNVKGSLSGFAPDRLNSGTYTVNADCSGTSTLNVAGLPFPIINRFIVVDNGQGFVSIVVSPQPVMISAVARKIHNRGM